MAIFAAENGNKFNEITIKNIEITIKKYEVMNVQTVLRRSNLADGKGKEENEEETEEKEGRLLCRPPLTGRCETYGLSGIHRIL